jgi:hypothetical protein
MAADWERGDDEPARLCRDSIRPGAQRPGSSEGGRGTGHSPAQGGRCGAAAATEEPRPVGLPTGYATAVIPAQPIRSNQRAIAGRRANRWGRSRGKPTNGRSRRAAGKDPSADTDAPRRLLDWHRQGFAASAHASRWTGHGLSAAAASLRARTQRSKAGRRPPRRAWQIA